MKRFVLSLLVLTVCVLAAYSDEPTNLLAGGTWEFSTDGGETFSETPPIIKSKQQAAIQVRIEFDISDPDGIDELELAAELSAWVEVALTLNGTAIDRPLPQMSHRAFRGIDASLLKSRGNVLTVAYAVLNDHDDDRSLPAPRMALNSLTSDDLAFQTGPILGVFDETSFTVTCRTSMMADVTLCTRPTGESEGNQIAVTSPRGLMHRFRADRREGYEYRLEATVGEVTRVTEWAPVPRWVDAADGLLRFAASGDGRTQTEKWTEVAEAIRAEQPQFMVFVGDMVTAGRNDWEWDTEHFGPASDLMASVPYYPVIGNHEQEAPVMRELFYTASDDGRDWNWTQQIGDVLLIGIVGHWSFAEGTDHRIWLEETLASSGAKFIFLFSHYPAWSSNRTGAVNDDGKPHDALTYQGQTVLMPLLAQYNATAFVAGHDHFYERSELPSGVSHIITGGGGAPIRTRPEHWQDNNPHSKVFASRYHYTVFDVEGDTCTMWVVADDGAELDRRVWSARPTAAASKGP